jgi:phosphate transport system permease protein
LPAYVPALVPAGILIAMVGLLIWVSRLKYLPGFFSYDWSPPTGHWGIGVFVVGSFLTAVPALVFSMAIGLGIAIASTTYIPKFVAAILDPFVDLLAGIPSVVYGIWAFLILGPIMGKQVEPWVYTHLGFLPGFSGPQGSQLGVGVPLAIVILTLMALPITTLLIRDALRSVPRDLWESGLALGATRWEVTRRVAIPYSTRGIVSAAFLGFGRAFGETVAVAMVVGSIASLPLNVYGETYTVAAAMFQLLDTSFVNYDLRVALVEMSLVLLAITLAVNLIGRRLISSLSQFQVAGL